MLGHLGCVNFESARRSLSSHTFADSLLRVHLRAVLHCVQGEVDFWDGPLVVDRMGSDVPMRIRRVSVHPEGRGRCMVWCKRARRSRDRDGGALEYNFGCFG